MFPPQYWGIAGLPPLIGAGSAVAVGTAVASGVVSGGAAAAPTAIDPGTYLVLLSGRPYPPGRGPTVAFAEPDDDDAADVHPVLYASNPEVA